MAKYSKAASEKVRDVMHEKKEGTLRSGSGKKVTSRKQAIAIALSEARKEGKKVPAKKSAAKKTSARKASAKKRGASKTAAKKTASRKTATKKAATKKSAARKR